MYYKQIQVGHITIEFHSNWLGEEVVIVNGQVVSRKASFAGTDHSFNVVENGTVSRYILTSKLSMMGEALLDLRKNHKLIAQNIPVPFTGSGKPAGRQQNDEDDEHREASNKGLSFELPVLFNQHKTAGLKKLNEYHTEDALEELKKAEEKNPKDAEIQFYKACAFSILEKPAEGFEALKKSVELGLNNRDSILTNEMLAYIRIQPAFEDFVHSNYTQYDPNKINPDKSN